MPHLGAIYLVAPTKASIRHILNDFHRKRIPHMYLEAWVFFTRVATDEEFAMVEDERKNNSYFKDRLMSCRQINLGYTAIDRTGD